MSNSPDVSNSTNFLQTRPFHDSTKNPQENLETSNIGHDFGELHLQTKDRDTPKNTLQPKLAIGNSGDNSAIAVVEQKTQTPILQKDETDNTQQTDSQSQQITTEEIYNQLQELKSWDAVKSKFISDQPEIMQQFVDFRKSYVDGKINELRKKYPTLIAKSVGSRDLSSDYDLTVSTPGTGEDVEAVDEFNKMVKSEFGVQSGTLFDTNLYAKDFLKVKENLIEEQSQPDTDLAQPENQELGKLTDLDQDVAALVKQRRFMNQVEWDKYTDSVVEGISDQGKKKAVLKQYEEADAIYQISAHNLLEAVKNDDNLVNKKVKLGKEEQVELAKIKDSNVREQVEKQLLGIEDLDLITHDNPDLVLEKSNQLYVDRMRQVRVLQCMIQNPENQDNIDALKTEVKKLLGEACFFAAEAYHSEGAVKHIVAGLQGDNAETELAKLTPEHILQSYNEQLGDFLKDIAHYTQVNAEDGKVFYRSSKYLYRLFDAVREIKKREEFTDINLSIGDEESLAQIIKSKLVAIRKGSIKFDNEDAKNQKAVEIVNNAFGVQTPEKLKQIVLKMSVEFNQKVRNKLSAIADKNTEKTYFQNVQVR
ncbi:MAG: hypothetical protein ACFB02_09675 [Mastigocoleus sp.]